MLEVATSYTALLRDMFMTCESPAGLNKRTQSKIQISSGDFGDTLHELVGVDQDGRRRLDDFFASIQQPD